MGSHKPLGYSTSYEAKLYGSDTKCWGAINSWRRYLTKQQPHGLMTAIC